VLFSRLGQYPRVWLEDALARGDVFETWAHEACFAPVADLLAHRAYNHATRRHWGIVNATHNSATQRQQLASLLEHIRVKGPVKSSEFKRTDGGTNGWWGWKDEKRWLETLFATGSLMVARRENFHRVYDLSERVAPAALALEARGGAPHPQGVHDQFVEVSIAALGITQARWVNDYYRLKPRLKDAVLDALVEQGRVQRVRVEGWDAPAYVHQCHARLSKQAAASQLQAQHTTLLSPFDPVVWDRERASALFGFDYRIECYTPEAQRTYGYFVLPILCHGELIGRLDAKAHRAEGVFEVKALFAQPGLKWTDVQVEAVAGAIARCAVWHDTPRVRLAATQPRTLRAALLRQLRATSLD
jgi:uncharacterized protein YcaQ